MLDQKDSYSNHVVVREQELEELLLELQKLHSNPKIYALTKIKKENNEAEKRVIFITSYADLLQELSHKQTPKEKEKEEK